MELKLNIYNENDEVEKTYTTQTFRIKLGLLNDFINIMNADRLSVVLKNVGNSKERDNEALISLVCELMNESKQLVYDLFKQLFKGLTDDELNKCYIDELVAVVKDLTKYAVKVIGLADKEKEKN